MKEELAYWMALAHLPKLVTARKNEVIVKCFENDISIISFFNGDAKVWQREFNLTTPEIELLKSVKSELINYSFLAEDLLEQGFKIIPITSPDYSPWLKTNMKRSYAPPLIYLKGNEQILQENSIAIVGSRNANKNSLDFTDRIVKKASKQNKTIVSGFARGVDKKALDSTIQYGGKSIIVLPQGITTFNNGFKKYYRQIVRGDVLVLSTYYPKATWNTAFAIGRNPVIYGLSEVIFVAQSDIPGGTWSGAIDGLKKRRKVFVRIPAVREKNANDQLIHLGATAVDQNGNIAEDYLPKQKPDERIQAIRIISEKEKRQILRLLLNSTYSSKEIIERLNLKITSRKLTSFLKQQKKIKRLAQFSPPKFTHIENEDKQQTLF